MISLEKVWINKRSEGESESNGDSAVPSEAQHEDSATSSVSLGDTHIWRDSGDSNV
jgi:hypothetical protein